MTHRERHTVDVPITSGVDNLLYVQTTGRETFFVLVLTVQIKSSVELVKSAMGLHTRTPLHLSHEWPAFLLLGTKGVCVCGGGGGGGCINRVRPDVVSLCLFLSQSSRDLFRGSEAK